MNLQKISFKSPVLVVQVFRKINEYGKNKRSFDSRREEMVWKEFKSRSGHISGGELYLPESVLNNSRFPSCNLITLEDSCQPEEVAETNHCFHMHHPNELYIFQIRQEKELELFLKYGYFEVGIPERNDFKICELKENNPVEIMINGKTDFSLSSRRARVFREQYYVFENLGKFSSCYILKEPVSSVVKKLPEKRKQVNMLKPLW